MKFSVGEIVTCYEMYGDLRIVKSSAIGLITKSTLYNNDNTPVYTVFYKGNNILFEEYQIEKLKK